MVLEWGTAGMVEWKTNETLAVGKGATLQQFVATIGGDQLEMEIAPWGEGQLKVNGREIAHINDAKDRRQAFRAVKQIAELYVEMHMNKSAAPMLPAVKAKLLDGKK